MPLNPFHPLPSNRSLNHQTVVIANVAYLETAAPGVGAAAVTVSLAARAEAAPGRKAEAIKARLYEQVATLLSASQRFDSDRLHQEAILLATKADIREELDRLASHGVQARKMLEEGGPAGRRLDFLAQELNRESNTLTAKANDVELANIGLELKSVVEQFREQVQNLE